MKQSAYKNLIENQECHWWYKGRRDVIKNTMRKYLLSTTNNILEIGCGAGGNLQMLKQFGEITAIEMDDFAREYAINSTGIDVKKGKLPDNLLTHHSSLDVVCLFDVLEHVQNDVKALLKIHDILKPEGLLVITVPAYQWLFGNHDKQLEHFRRYSMKGLIKLIKGAGFSVTYKSYFNFLLFPVAVIMRILNNFNKKLIPLGTNKPNDRINKLLYKVFKQEAKIIPRFKIPFGLSIIVVLRKS